MAKKQSIRFSVMKVAAVEQGPAEVLYNEAVYEVLNRTATINERKMLLNEQDPEGDCDFIMDFRNSNELLFGSFSRLAAGSESSFPVQLLNERTISINDVVRNAQDGSAGSISDTVFFCISRDLMIMTSGHRHRKTFETYLNWLFRQNGRTGSQCSITPKIKDRNELPLKNIQSIQIGDSYLHNALEEIRHHRIESSALRAFFTDVVTLDRIQEKDILEAVLTFKVKKRAVNKAREMETLVRIVDDEDIVVIGRDGKRFRGSEFKLATNRKIERSSDGFYNTQEIEAYMRDIIRKARNDENID